MTFWEYFWTFAAGIALFIEVTLIAISVITQHYQNIPQAKSWKSLFYIHNPDMLDKDGNPKPRNR